MTDDSSDGVYANIRNPDLLGPLIGQRIIDVTQHDREEWEENRKAYVTLHCESGLTVTFWIGGDGFDINDEMVRVTP